MDDLSERLVAADVVRGVSRLFARNDIFAVPEVPLRNNRRADLMAVDAKGVITIVEIKVSRADLLGDGKWTDYLEFCDQFYWAVPQGFDLTLFDRAALNPESAGLIVADRYDGAIVRAPLNTPLAGARRKVETLRLARMAARRLLVVQSGDDGLVV
jgi:hypothetical protein